MVPWFTGIADVLTGPFITRDKVLGPLLTMVLFSMGFFGLRQSVIFSAEEEEPLPPATAVPEARKMEFFSPEELARWKDRLSTYVEKEKPYLNPELRLVDLAHGLGLKAYQVSEILNRGLGFSFYDYVNGLRVQEVKKRLMDPQYSHFSILGIANETGFNSKSVFNESFRRLTGMTPSAYRETKNPS